jgi:hypothetical protein
MQLCANGSQGALAVVQHPDHGPYRAYRIVIARQVRATSTKIR